MAVLIGIDEAGYGPLLGPLTVTCTAFMLPDELLRADMWELLASSVSKQKKNLRGRMLITDSKKAFDRKGGLGHLERTSLAAMHSIGIKPESLLELLSAVSPDVISRLGRYPWYGTLDKVRIAPPNSDYSIAAGAFKKNAGEKGISLIGVHSQVFDVGHYNEMVEKVQNKASVLFTGVCRHIEWAFRHFGEQNLQIVVDRQGGRSRYLSVLSRMFPGTEGRILKETETDCSYELTEGSRKMRIHFVVKADDKFLPVSLASIISKYIRELMMERINNYFMNLNSGICCTAGYWTDGTRFLQDIEKLLPELNINRNLLVRTR